MFVAVYQTRSKGSENLPQGFVGLTLIFKDFQGFSWIFMDFQGMKKISSQSWQKIN